MFVVVMQSVNAPQESKDKSLAPCKSTGMKAILLHAVKELLSFCLISVMYYRTWAGSILM